MVRSFCSLRMLISLVLVGGYSSPGVGGMGLSMSVASEGNGRRRALGRPERSPSTAPARVVHWGAWVMTRFTPIMTTPSAATERLKGLRAALRVRRSR
jgi:hypothetical protein